MKKEGTLVGQATALGHVADRARAGDVVQRRRGRIGREHEDRGVGQGPAHRAREISAGPIRQVVVGDDDVRLVLVQRGDRCLDVMDHRLDLDPIRRLEGDSHQLGE